MFNHLAKIPQVRSSYPPNELWNSRWRSRERFRVSMKVPSAPAQDRSIHTSLTITGPMTARAKARFEGTVQGVSFRAYTRRYAISAGVCGWVRNLPDGSVEAVLEGDREAVEGVIHRLCTEHPMAVVQRCDIQWEPPTGEFDSFSIRR